MAGGKRGWEPRKVPYAKTRLGLTPELEELGARRAGLSVIADNRATIRLVSAS